MKEKFSVNIAYSSFSSLVLWESDFFFFSVPFLRYCQGHLWACVAAYIYTEFINCTILTRYKLEGQEAENRIGKGEGSI